MTRNNMRCPTCQSINTQTLQAAFDQNSRNDGRRSFNQFAMRVGPPMERETVTWPLIALCLTTYLADLAIVVAAAL